MRRSWRSCGMRARSSWPRRTSREYAVDGARSSFGGTFCNPYDTEREPGMSSAGSGTAVAANLVTCAIGEETVVSVRWPAAVNSIVGLAPTKELVSTDGMIGAGLNMRVGPMCRTVADTARILDVIAGYDPEGRVHRAQRRAHAADVVRRAATARSLAGLRIGVVREYLNRTLLAQADAESVDSIERAIARAEEARRHGRRPGPEGRAVSARASRASAPELLSARSRAESTAVPGECVRAAGGRSDRDVRGDARRTRRACRTRLTLRTLGGGSASRAKTST